MDMGKNLIINFIAIGVGIFNAVMIKKFIWYRTPVALVNTFIAALFLPIFNIYRVDDIFMLSIPMHYFTII